MTDEIILSGTVLGIQRQTPETIKVSIRALNGTVCDMMLPFSQEEKDTQLSFNIDNMINIRVLKISEK